MMQVRAMGRGRVSWRSNRTRGWRRGGMANWPGGDPPLPLGDDQSVPDLGRAGGRRDPLMHAVAVVFPELDRLVGVGLGDLPLECR